MKAQRRNEILHKKIVDRLRDIRKQRGLTQEDVRFDLDINIGRVEIGKHSITISTLACLCEYYGVSLCEFFRDMEC